jgi:glycine/D-amino acid oxidase-like deaminating enzyme
MSASENDPSSSSHDLIVVGSGIVGAMTALFALQRHPTWRVLVVDRSMIGCGSTMYSAYMDFPYGPGPDKRAMAERSAQLYQQLRAQRSLAIRDLAMIGICAPERLEAVSHGLVGSPPGQPWSEANRAMLKRAIVGFTPPVGTVGITGLQAAVCTDQMLPETILRGLAADGRCMCLEGVEVSNVTRGAGQAGLEVRTRDGRRFDAARVALCLGPWLPGALQGIARATVPVRVKKVVALHIPIAPPLDAPLIYLFDDEAFLLPQPEKCRWLFSFRSEEWDCLPEVSSLQISTSDWARATSILRRYLPTGAGLELGGRVFCDAYTATGEPLVQLLPELPGCVVAGAGSGSGFRLAPAIAERAVALLSEGVQLKGTP